MGPNTKKHASPAKVMMMQKIFLLSKDTINAKRPSVRAHRTFCTYLKKMNYEDVNFEESQEMLHFPVITAENEQ